MAKSNSVLIYALDCQGGAKKVSEDEFSQKNIKENSLYWLHMSLDKVETFFKNYQLADEFVQQVLSAKETRPRVITYNNTLLATIRAINLNKSSQAEDMISLRIFASTNLIITVQRRALTLADEMAKSLEEKAGPKSASDFLENLLTIVTDQLTDLVSKFDNQMDKVEKMLSSESQTATRYQLSQIRKKVILLRRYLIPQRDAISRIYADKLSWIDAIEGIYFREISDANTRLLENLDTVRERSIVLHEELFSISQEKMNQKMYMLAIVAVIFIPLSFFTGLLGINVGGIPGAEYKHGFLVVCLILFVVLILQVIYLWRKRWI